MHCVSPVRAWGMTVGAAAATALLLWVASPAVGVGWLAWVALVPAATAALALEGTLRGRAVVPLAYGLYLETQFVPALPFGIAERQWGSPPLPILVRGSPVVFAALVAVPLVALLLYALRFPQPLDRPRPAALVLVPAAAWTGLDFLRVKLDPSGLWGPLFLTQHELPTAPPAALGGPWLLTLLIVASAWALAALALRRPRALASAAAVGLVVVALALASAGLRSTPRGDPVTVGVVQPGYDTSEYDEYEPARFFDARLRDRERATLALVADLGELTREAAARGAELVLWPEAVAWVDPRDNERVRRALAELVLETRVALAVPTFVEPESGVVGFRREAEPTELRPKHRPMWFLGERTFEAEAGPKELGPVAFGTMLGVDNQDPASARGLARLGAELLGSATHDWRELAPQQRAYAQLHAATLRLPVARADWRYGSALWDASGRIVADAGLDRERTVLVAAVEPGGPATPYERLGDVVAWTSAAATLALLALGIRRRRRGSRAA